VKAVKGGHLMKIINELRGYIRTIRGGNLPDEGAIIKRAFGRFLTRISIRPDGGIALLLSSMEYVELKNKNLKPLQLTKRLHELEITSERVTDNGMAYLRGQTNLKTLRLNCPLLTNQGLIHLGGLASLQKLEISTRFGRIGEDAVKKLIGDNPGLEVVLHEEIWHEAELMKIDTKTFGEA
jgi:hypothetical protein